MSENRYTRTVDSITPPEESVQKMLDAVRQQEQKEKIIHMSTLKKSVIAASLAVAIMLGAVFGIPALSHHDNPFTLTVNAAEVSDKGFTNIGTLDPISSTWTTDDKTDRVVITEFFEFNVRVEGENIDHVLYTIENGSFGTNAENEYDYSKNLYQSDIVTAEMDEKDFTCLWLRADSWDNTLPEKARQAIRDWYDHANARLERSSVQENYSDESFDISACTKAIYDAMLDRLKINVEITFTDGKVENKTLIFTCDSVEKETGIETISAKLI